MAIIAGPVAPPEPLDDAITADPIPEMVGVDVMERRHRQTLLDEVGPPPVGMDRPHAHHILPQRGIGPRRQELVREGRAILEEHGIDPVEDAENLTWAPNVQGQHTTEKVEALVEDLRERNADPDVRREDIEEVLREHGEIAREHTPD